MINRASSYLSVLTETTLSSTIWSLMLRWAYVKATRSDSSEFEYLEIRLALTFAVTLQQLH